MAATAGSSLSIQVPFSVIRHHLVAHLVDNFDHRELDQLESRLLDALCSRRELKGVIFNFSEVVTTDPLDLKRLNELFSTIKLTGGKIGLCGISPGLATVMVGTDLNFQRLLIGADLDDLLSQL